MPMSKIQVLKFDQLPELVKFHDKLKQTIVLSTLQECPANLFLYDIGNIYQFSLYSLDDKDPEYFKTKPKKLVPDLFDMTMDCCMLDAAYDNVLEDTSYIDKLNKIDNVYDKVLSDYSLIGTQLEKVVLEMYTQLTEYNIHERLLALRNGIDINEDYSNDYITLTKFNRQQMRPCYIVDNRVLENKGNLVKNDVVDKIIKKDNAGFINWPFDVAPDIKSGTNLLIIDCYDKTYTSLVENVKNWSRVKRFKIII